MRIYFIAPESSTEAMALKYWKAEYAEHGEKLFEVDTEVPIKLKSE